MADTVSEQIAALSDEDWAIREEAATLLGPEGCAQSFRSCAARSGPCGA